MAVLLKLETGSFMSVVVHLGQSPYDSQANEACAVFECRAGKYAAAATPTAPITTQYPTHTHGLHGISAISTKGVTLAHKA